MSIVGVIHWQMAEDDTDDSDRMIELWLRSNAEQRKLIDELLVCLCGWSFATLMEKMAERETPGVLYRKGWRYYPIEPDAVGNFTEQLDLIGVLVGAMTYEWMLDPGGERFYVRRVD
jgi:hypothetical protein